MPENNNESWEAYTEYNKILRAWFVAFGFGVPATFLINNELNTYISPETGKPHIFVIFMIGAVAQVGVAFVNKTINWCSYYKETYLRENDPKNVWQKIVVCLSKASNWYLIDFLGDLTTISCFVYAIFNLFSLLMSSHSC